MSNSSNLLRQRRFLPLFVTQLLNAFNDNLYKTAMVLFVVYSVYDSAVDETFFSGLASAIFILPFFFLSALAGQLADMRDKASIIRKVKAAEIAIMIVGATGLNLAANGQATKAVAIPLMLLALFAMGVHSTFMGAIKYSILPQHLKREEVLPGTGLVEAGTYLAIMGGTIMAGFISMPGASVAVIALACIGYASSRQIPPAPPLGPVQRIDFNPLSASITIVRDSMRQREVFLAILAISFFWSIGAILFIQFPPLAKNVLMASPQVASLFLVMFSIGIAIGSVAINSLLKGDVSARFAPWSVIAMAAMVLAFYLVCKAWQDGMPASGLLSAAQFIDRPLALALLGSLLGIAIFGGMFVVPLYAFLTTRVERSKASRAVAANNIVNAGAMVAGSMVALALSGIGLPLEEQILLSAGLCLVSAWLGWQLHRAETPPAHDGADDRPLAGPAQAKKVSVPTNPPR